MFWDSSGRRQVFFRILLGRGKERRRSYMNIHLKISFVFFLKFGNLLGWRDKETKSECKVYTFNINLAKFCIIGENVSAW